MHDLVFNERGEALMVYRLRDGAGIPWHRHGRAFENGLTLEQAASECGFYREVALLPAGYESCNIGGLPEFSTMAGHYAVVDSSGRQLGMVQSRYSVLQDYKVIQSLRPLVDLGFEVETAGMLSGGSRAWLQLKRTENCTAEVRPGDPVTNFLLWYWSHDGSTGIQGGDVATRAVCANTVAAATKEGSMLKLRHCGDIQGKLDTLIQAYEFRFEENLDLWRAFAGRTVNQTDLDRFLDAFTGKDAADVKKKGIREQITEAFESGIGNTQSTYWDLYNGVTQVISHSTGRGSDSDGDKALRSLQSQWLGNGAKQISKASNILKAWL